MSAISTFLRCVSSEKLSNIDQLDFETLTSSLTFIVSSSSKIRKHLLYICSLVSDSQGSVLEEAKEIFYVLKDFTSAVVTMLKDSSLILGLFSFLFNYIKKEKNQTFFKKSNEYNFYFQKFQFNFLVFPKFCL